MKISKPIAQAVFFLLGLMLLAPGCVVETREGWERQEVPFADFDWCKRLAKLVANSTRQRIDEESPLLSAWRHSARQDISLCARESGRHFLPIAKAFSVGGQKPAETPPPIRGKAG